VEIMDAWGPNIEQRGGGDGNLVPPEALKAVAAAGDLLGTIAEVVVGYRKRLADGGIGGDAADTMAKDMHDMLLSQMKTQAAAQSAAALMAKVRGR